MSVNTLLLFMGFLLALPACSSAAEAASLLRPEHVVVGILAHDRGPTSDHNEDGIDPTIELQYRPPQGPVWRSIGSPRPHLGFTPNFSGDTSMLYGGGSYEFDIGTRLFATGGLGLALHNGPLHNDDRVACEVDSDCGFGYRVLLRYALEFGIHVDQASDITLFYDHMSHKWVFGGENEGIDHIGLRYRFRY